MKFGKKKAPPTKESLAKLRNSVAMLEKREEFLQKKMDDEMKLAKAKLAKKDKKGAMAHLKRKKNYEAQVDKIQGSRLTLETQMMTLESASVTSESLKAMQHGQKSMKKLNKQMKIEKVEASLDQIRDQIEDHEEVSLAMSEGIGQNDMLDMGELEDELAELEMEGLDEELSLPSAPSSTPSRGKAQKTKSEAQELRELEAMMAL
mmetsp:Transcript_8683/g.14960  ORF Transcript_8683/g.14960 Transcript_8683/m.14960 type:complete len:205 (+) Transcript_8683:7-621(+)|eukprot:CAMPEP_0168595646 /NCGR_PEP_ID=MMETSP0420-20121227/9584_1 /TAXON_ID=498008 /ORGANISM="Pessonella sp." /LENGTH=204 /DNA_ID=CAMNT_0008632129 /DNA_START=7 /DNA_END=621 /DNA_ORIENTATION=-